MSYLEDQLTEVRELIKSYKELIAQDPDRLNLKIGLRSLEGHERELIEKIEEE
jgi:hypothetical protein